LCFILYCYIEIKDDERRIALSYYPMLSWDGSARSTFHVHAYILKKTEGLVFETLEKMENAWNV